MYNKLNDEIIGQIKKNCGRVFSGADISPDYADLRYQNAGFGGSAGVDGRSFRRYEDML